LEVLASAAGGDDDQALGQVAAQGVDGAAFLGGVLVAVEQEGGVAVAVGGVLDALGELRVEGVEDVGDDHANGAGLPLAEAAGDDVGLVAEFARGGQDAFAGGAGDHVRAGQGAGGGGGTDLRELGDVLDAGH